MPGDCSRWDYDKYIALETGSCITPCFTCTNMDQAFELINKQLYNHQKDNTNTPILRN